MLNPNEELIDKQCFISEEKSTIRKRDIYEGRKFKKDMLHCRREKYENNSFGNR